MRKFLTWLPAAAFLGMAILIISKTVKVPVWIAYMCMSLAVIISPIVKKILLGLGIGKRRVRNLRACISILLIASTFLINSSKLPIWNENGDGVELSQLEEPVNVREKGKTEETNRVSGSKYNADIHKGVSAVREGISDRIDAFVDEAAAAVDEVDAGNEESEEESADQQEHLREVTLVRVVDGDTLIVDCDGDQVRVRLLEVDTPESVHVDSSRNNEYGTMASDFTKLYLKNKTTLYLSYDEENEDLYGRTLAYVWMSKDVNIENREDIETYMLNAILIKEGMARVTVYAPNDHYQDIMEELQQKAQEDRVGLWKYDEYWKITQNIQEDEMTP